MESSAGGSSSPSPPNEVSGHGSITLKVTPILTSLSAICVLLRFISRRVTSTVGLDDWVCLAALATSFGSLIATILNVTVAKAGYSLENYTYSLLIKFFKTALAHNIFYQTCVSLTKASILLFYRRLFAITRPFSTLIWIMCGIVVAYYFAAIFVIIFAFVHAQRRQSVPSPSFNYNSFILSMGIINSVLDIVVLLVPQRSVWKLHMTWKRRFLVSLLFMVGGCVCIVSIIRFLTLGMIVKMDVTVTSTISGMWALIEESTGIICACLPLLHSLIRHWRGKSLTRNTGANSSSGPYAPTISRSSRHRHPNNPSLQDSSEILYRDIELMSPTANKGGLSVEVRTDIETHWEAALPKTRADSD